MENNPNLLGLLQFYASGIIFPSQYYLPDHFSAQQLSKIKLQQCR
jgi:hypothetical protein